MQVGYHVSTVKHLTVIVKVKIARPSLAIDKDLSHTKRNICLFPLKATKSNSCLFVFFCLKLFFSQRDVLFQDKLNQFDGHFLALEILLLYSKAEIRNLVGRYELFPI